MNYKLICFDIDGVIFKDVNFWMELHKSFNTLEQGKILTEKYLHSDYPRLVEEVVVNLWKGRDAKPYFDLVNSLEYLPGVKQMFDYVKSKGFISALISASSIEVARRVQKDFGVDHIFANELIIRDNKVSGDVLLSSISEKADAISPVPGGVGPMTIVSLFQNLLQAYNLRD